VVTHALKADRKEVAVLGAQVFYEKSSRGKPPTLETWTKDMKKRLGVKGAFPDADGLYELSQQRLEELLTSSKRGTLATERQIMRDYKKYPWGGKWFTLIKDEIVKHYGKELSPEMMKVYAYLSQATEAQAATTMAAKVYGQLSRGVPVDRIKAGRFSQVEDKVRKILRKEYTDFFRDRKLLNFLRASDKDLAGSELSVTADIQLARYVGVDKWTTDAAGRAKQIAPTATERSYIEQVTTGAAKRLKVPARDVEAAVWTAQKMGYETTGLGGRGVVPHFNVLMHRSLDRAFRDGTFEDKFGKTPPPEYMDVFRFDPREGGPPKGTLVPGDSKGRTQLPGEGFTRAGERKRGGEKPYPGSLNYYTEHAIPEPFVVGATKALLKSKVSKGLMYDLEKDVLGFKKMADHNYNLAEEYIYRSGYLGYIDGAESGIVRIFDKLNVEKVLTIPEGEGAALHRQSINSSLQKYAKGALFGGGVLLAMPYLTGKDGEEFSPASMGWGLTAMLAITRGKRGQSNRGVNIRPMSSYWERISAPGGLRPGVKLEAGQVRTLKLQAAEALGIADQMRVGKQGQLIAPSGWGRRLSKMMDIELARNQIALANQHGIAIRTTKAGKPALNIKRSGVYVPVSVAEWKRYKDIAPGWFGSKDITRAIQEMDGSLDVKGKAALEGQAGPLEQHVLWRARDIEAMKGDFVRETTDYLKGMFDGLTDAEKVQISKLHDGIISNKMAYIDVEKLATFNRVEAITTDLKVLSRAQELRKWYDTMRVRQNEMRVKRGQKEIPYRRFYSPHLIREITIWEKTFGGKLTPADLMANVELPDYISPEAAFNPHAMARMGGIADWAREMDASKLAERYANAAASDMFNTSIIQNTKAFADQMDAMGYPSNAQFLRDWAAEVYGGIKGAIDRKANLRPIEVGKFSLDIRRGMAKYRKMRALAVFPLNISWNAVVQTSSSVLTYARYGNRACLLGGVDWLTNKKLRSEIAENAYSYRVKTEKSGRITRQDVEAGNVSRVQVRRSKLETAQDAANYFTETIERHLTGWSIAAARRHGLANGLKGKGLWEYASDGGGKTQSMYNRADLPGILRNELVKTAAPFQTFAFELYNTMKEVAGQTGMSQGTFRNRMGFLLRLMAGAATVNYIGGALTGREPWELKSFLPFSNFWLEPIVSITTGKQYTGASRGLPGVASEAYTLMTGAVEYIKTGKTDKLRKFILRYGTAGLGLPGGVQISKTVDGIIAVAEEGVYDNLGAAKFKVQGTSEQVKAILAGPYATEAGKEYLDTRSKSVADLFFKDEPAKKRFSTAKTRVRNAIRNQQYDKGREIVTEWNRTFNGTTLQMPLFEEMYIETLMRDLKKEKADDRD
jgi:hypothetical protein